MFVLDHVEVAMVEYWWNMSRLTVGIFRRAFRVTDAHCLTPDLTPNLPPNLSLFSARLGAPCTIDYLNNNERMKH